MGEVPLGEQILRLLREAAMPMPGGVVAALMRGHPPGEVREALDRLARARLIACEVRRTGGACGRHERVYLDPAAARELWGICPECEGTGRVDGRPCIACVPVLFAAPSGADRPGRVAARRRVLAAQLEARGIR